MTIKSLLLHLYGERRDQAGQASGAGGVGDAVCLVVVRWWEMIVISSESSQLYLV